MLRGSIVELKRKMRIESNIVGLNIANRLQQTSRAISNSLERLSTGRRVNRPQDDNVAFSLGIKLDSQIRGLRQSNLNINQAAGLLQTADSAISTQVEVLQKIRELALQASSSTITSNDRDSISTQVNALLEEFDRITNATEFAGTQLLNGSAEEISLLLGSDEGSAFSFSLPNTRSSEVFRKTIGTGEFEAFEELGNDIGSGNVRAADVNGDGILDIIELESTAPSYGIRLGNGDGTFGSVSTYETIGDVGVKFLVEDLNDDGILDLISTDLTDVGINFGNGDGSFQSTVTYNLPGTNGIFNREDLKLVDVNDDGLKDIVTLNNNNLYIALNDGSGSFSDSTTFTTSLSGDLAVGDVNGDGLEDLLISSTSAAIEVLFNDGNGGFNSNGTISVSTGNSWPSLIELADLNNDGMLDLLNANLSTGTLGVSLGNGDGSFGAESTISASAFTDYQIVDVNGDGFNDVIGLQSTNIGVALNDGDGTLRAMSTYAGPFNAGNMDVGDFDEDGVIDILALYGSTPAILFGRSQNVTARADLKFNTVEQAQASLEIVDAAIQSLLENRTELASSLNRLESASAFNLLISESLQEAKSNALDADFARETAELVSQQILQQAQIAALTQANTNAQMVTSLLSSL